MEQIEEIRKLQGRCDAMLKEVGDIIKSSAYALAHVHIK